MLSFICQHILSFRSASLIRQGFNVLEGDDGSGREYLMEQDTPDLLCSCVDSEDDDSVGYRSEVGWSESSESGSSMHYTDSIEDLVGRDWLVHEGGIVSLE
ncbi:hypothetical protein FIBSPDRAFT_970424 [Athelia psychrophila]|uniref:Uncharacterized protein n=1 Tax=Athelia psychrophila TaxID=1759441 RepID=A0A167SPS1_9AGAM|nr:hypothetical protein FIBSPDRAFT_970424 [Fibularhizoctonia sp. CBS 109695]